ncbi:LOW QUALITY PROTEIN: uncharacterized protein LOC115374818 [Xyrichtys novacula]|uniref:LOW QUALITY PROTEIN: uncharacterized protein LOC115374818 n=1 Tax=Xyrichtys novacula TaxID=13765 RepID=A0AAV1EWE7_XYRNO|nr:LOW QUALITY PROTEIN: uncharacterized protein LOC115374818 [Xyrichtys novacula]
MSLVPVKLWVLLNSGISNSSPPLLSHQPLPAECLPPLPPPPENPSELVSFYNHTLSSCLDQLAPIRTKYVTFKHSAPLYTTELCGMKAHGRQLERLCKKTNLNVHCQAYADHLHRYKDALNSARSAYHSNLINSSSSNPKVLFSTINKLLKPHDNITDSFTATNVNFCRPGTCEKSHGTNGKQALRDEDEEEEGGEMTKRGGEWSPGISCD